MDELLQDWFNQQREETPDEMLWKKASAQQIMFVRDYIAELVASGTDFATYKSIVRVISQHTSKSVKLPVYSLSRPDLGLRLVMRENFYNWKLSVISEREITSDFTGLFHTTPPPDPDYTGDPLHSVYFEGFPQDLKFGYLTLNRQRWSAEIWGDSKFYTVVFLIMRELGAIGPHEWSRRKSP